MAGLFEDDIEGALIAPFIDWKLFSGKSFFITGATGLVGFSLINLLLKANEKYTLNLKIIALVRDIEKAKERFFSQKEYFASSLIFLKGDVISLPEIESNIDFIVHGASITKSRSFVETPADTLITSLMGTKSVLDLALKKKVTSFVYLSSMEVYGSGEKGVKITEDRIGSFLPSDPRSSYPIGKIACEALCFSYASQFGLNSSAIRLTQTFGPGASYNDTRVFAYFARCMHEKKDIVLKTRGETERNYLYTSDATTAILCVLQKGKAGEAYNAADEDTYCSIADMAYRAAKEAGVSVRFELEDLNQNGYPETLYMDLDTKKLRDLGWYPLQKSDNG